MFAKHIPYEWKIDTLNHCLEFPKNKYFLQTKNPGKLLFFSNELRLRMNFSICTTLETNRYYENIMEDTPLPNVRAHCLSRSFSLNRHITIEPIMDFDLPEFIEMIQHCQPVQVNIGADSSPKRNKMPEPPREKILELIEELEKFTTVVQKKNLKRLLKRGDK